MAKRAMRILVLVGLLLGSSAILSADGGGPPCVPCKSPTPSTGTPTIPTSPK